jgi:L-asparagine transporter-like permease
MSKHKWNKLFTVILMIVFLLLLLEELIGNSEYRVPSIASHATLFLFGVYFFYLNRKNKRKRKDKQKE